MAPNQAGVTNIAYLKTVVKGYEARGLKGAAILSALSSDHGTNSNRYLYTDKYGWVDLRHFGQAAALANSIGSVTTEILGFGLEIRQFATEWGDDYRSGFSSEDLSSNAAGASFGDDYLGKARNVSSDLSSWLSDVGARNPSDPATGMKQLPKSDPSVRTGNKSKWVLPKTGSRIRKKSG